MGSGSGFRHACCPKPFHDAFCMKGQPWGVGMLVALQFFMMLLREGLLQGGGMLVPLNPCCVLWGFVHAVAALLHTILLFISLVYSNRHMTIKYKIACIVQKHAT